MAQPVRSLEHHDLTAWPPAASLEGFTTYLEQAGQAVRLIEQNKKIPQIAVMASRKPSFTPE
jgi:hypothetical protein